MSDPSAAAEVRLHPLVGDLGEAAIPSGSVGLVATSPRGATCSRTLVQTYEDVVPSVVAFISKWVRTPHGAPPLAPPIFGTGFLVHQDGIVATNRHVVDIFAKLPTHPKTGAPGYGAILFQPGVSDEHGPYIRWMIAEIFGHTTLGDFTSSAPWFGEETPDIAFVQLRLRDTPFLKLASNEFYIRPGTPIATAGFPMGEKSMSVMKKLNQLIPFVRHGIVSSVFPFAVPHPHGFTIDVMQQGGSSGSPIFYENSPTVVGMMAASLLEPVSVGGGGLALSINFPTNISIAVPAHLIEGALQSFRSTYSVDRSSFPTLEEWQKEKQDVAPGVGWDVIGPA